MRKSLGCERVEDAGAWFEPPRTAYRPKQRGPYFAAWSRALRPLRGRRFQLPRYRLKKKGFAIHASRCVVAGIHALASPPASGSMIGDFSRNSFL
jgi:hypothetical protein